MKRTAIALATTAALGLAAAAVAAVVASASGSGHITFGSSQERISFNAARNDDGTATGSAQVVDDTASGVVRFHVDVNCLNVFGNVAIVSGLVTSSNVEALLGMEAVFEVVDNGEGAGDPPDLMSLVDLHTPGVGADCTIPAEFAAGDCLSGFRPLTAVRARQRCSYSAGGR